MFLEEIVKKSNFIIRQLYNNVYIFCQITVFLLQYI